MSPCSPKGKLLNNTYVDDIIDSFSNTVVARKVIKEIDKLIEKGGFVIKKWVTSDINTVEEAIDIKVFLKDHSVLGMIWKKSEDVIKYRIKLNLYS